MKPVLLGVPSEGVLLVAFATAGAGADRSPVLPKGDAQEARTCKMGVIAVERLHSLATLPVVSGEATTAGSAGAGAACCSARDASPISILVAVSSSVSAA